MQPATPSSTQPPAVVSTSPPRPQTTAPSIQPSSPPQASSPSLAPMTWQNRGNFHLDRKELDLAVDAFTNALQEAEEKKNSLMIAIVLKDLGRVFLEKGQWVLAANIRNGSLAVLHKETLLTKG